MEERKRLLSLYDHSGVWSKPYLDSGWEVVQIDLELNGEDARLLKYDPPFDGILSAPPCCHFALSGARWWRDKGTEPLIDGLSLVDAVMRAVVVYKPAFWVLENPVGRLINYLGKPAMYFHPYEYGDPYKKKTALWGRFNAPMKNPVEPTEGSKMHRMSSTWKRQRSVTPRGFAEAFFEANH